MSINPFDEFIDPFKQPNLIGNHLPKDPIPQPAQPVNPNANPFDFFVPDPPTALEPIPEMTPELAAFLADQELLQQEIQQRDFDDKKNVAQLFELSEEAKLRKDPWLKQALEQSSYDGDLFKDMVDDSSVLSNTLKEAEQILRTLPKLAQDQFLSLFKMEPKLVEREQMLQEFRINHTFLQQTMESDDYLKMVPSCTLDMLCSSIGTEVLLRQILNLLKEKLEEHKKAAEEAKQQGQQDPNGPVNMNDWVQAVNEMVDTYKNLKKDQASLDQTQAMLAHYQNMQQSPPSALTKLKNDLGMDIKQAKMLAEQLAKVVEDNAPKHMPDMEMIIKSALSDAEPQVSEVSDLIGQWGFDDDGTGNVRITMDNKKRALERLRSSSKMKKIANLVGHFRKIAQDSKKRKNPNGKVAIKSVTVGGDITSAIPSELALLSNNITKADFMNRWSENRLLEYKKETTSFMGKGPIVVVDDVSGSMRGQKEEWSKALCLAFIEIAQQQKRDFACILFSSTVSGKWVVQKGFFDPNVVIDIAESFKGGGTNFEAPLNAAMNVIEDSKFKKAKRILA